MSHPADAPFENCRAVIFTNQIRDEPSADDTAAGDGYAATADRMVRLAERHPGFLGIDSARNADGFGITVSYWRDEKAIADWRADVEHAEAQRLGREKWYQRFTLRVARVERGYGFDRAGE